jgi:glycosyltransferase involved in cell wall biosynthesis
VIAVDDGSTDGSYELLQTMKIKNLQVLKNPGNRGVNYTRNRGIEQATGDYVLFLDSDDKLMPDGFDTVVKHVNENLGVKHFLFFVSTNQNTSAKAPYTTSYKDWLTEKVFGDFTHVIERSVLLQFPFFEQFRAYENLNWQRILKFTEPQQVVPKTITWVDLERTDNLTKTLRLKSTEAITGKFNYLKFYLGLYGADLYAFDPALFKKKFQHALMLGIAAGKKKEAIDMINALPMASKGIYKSFVALAPSGVLNTLIRSK